MTAVRDATFTCLLGFLLAASAVAATPEAGAVDPKLVVGPPQGAPLSGKALKERAQALSQQLRCPVCQVAVADSGVTLALQMRGQIKQMLAEGYQDEQILSYFEHSYGEFVRLDPVLKGVNWLVWLAPLAGLGLGVWVVRGLLRPATLAGTADGPAASDESLSPPAATGPGDTTDAPGPASLPEDPELARYVLRVRELAYGWPEGRRPESSS